MYGYFESLLAPLEDMIRRNSDNISNDHGLEEEGYDGTYTGKYSENPRSQENEETEDVGLEMENNLNVSDISTLLFMSGMEIITMFLMILLDILLQRETSDLEHIHHVSHFMIMKKSLL